MEIFTKKKLIHKIIIALLIVILISQIFIKPVHAIDLEALGGQILDPIMSLFVAIGDGVMGLIQENILGIEESIININTSTGFWATIIVTALTILVAVVCIAGVILSGGAGALAIAATAFNVAKVVIIVAGVTAIFFPLEKSITEGMLPGNFYLPLYEISPYEIFSNKLKVLDANFFEPMESVDNSNNNNTWTLVVESPGAGEEGELFINGEDLSLDQIKIAMEEQMYNFMINTEYGGYTGLEENVVLHRTVVQLMNGYDDNGNPGGPRSETIEYEGTNGTMYRITISGLHQDTYFFYYHIKIERLSSYGGDGNQNAEPKESTASQLRGVIASWYYVLRNIAVIISMIILLYIGIKMMTSSIAEDKAKHKQMLLDWLISICLIFSMQYIMVFANYFVSKIVGLIDTIQYNGINEVADYAGYNNKFQGVEFFKITDSDKVEKAYEIMVEDGESEEMKGYFLQSDGVTLATSKNDAAILYWPAENFMQQARIKLQLLDGEDSGKTASIGWKLIFVVLVVYTVIFLWTYIKRIVYLAFLTIISPLVALTYPIDKITDGKAQAFDMWLKEYIFNLLIQPMHLLLYMILIGSAMSFAGENILYVVVALGFMTPAEKLVRRFFGFEKAHTPGLLAGPAGAALMMTGINKLTHMRRRPDGGQNSGAGNNSSKENDLKTYGATSEYSKYGEANDLLGGIPEGSEPPSGPIQGGEEEGEPSSGSIPGGAEGEEEYNPWEEYATNSDNYMDEFGGIPEGSEPPPGSVPGGAEGEEEYNPWEEYATNSDNYMDEFGGIPEGSEPPSGPAQGGGQPPSSFESNSDNEENPVDEGKGLGENKGNEDYSRWDKVKNLSSKIWNAPITRASRAYTRQRLINRGNKIRNYNLGRKVAGVATGAVGGAIGLTAGAITGITSGDPTKGAQFGVTGAVGGYSAAKGIGTGIYDRTAYKGSLEEMERAYYGKDYQKHQRELAEKEFKKKEENIKYLREHLNLKRSEAKKMMESQVTQDCLNAGLYNMADIATVNSLVTREKNPLSSKEAVMLASFAKDMKDSPKAMGKKTYEDYVGKYKRNFENKGQSSEKAEKMARNLMERAERIYFAEKENLTVDDL